MYEAALDPAQWQSALAAMRAECGATAVIWGVADSIFESRDSFAQDRLTDDVWAIFCASMSTIRSSEPWPDSWLERLTSIYPKICRILLGPDYKTMDIILGAQADAIHCPRSLGNSSLYTFACRLRTRTFRATALFFTTVEAA